jgi:hypothetical protein
VNAALKKICQIPGALILLVLTSATLVIVERVTTAQESTSVPNFEMDPLFFQNLPNRWTTGQVGGISVDNQDHIWILHRPATIAEGERSAALNPPAALCCIGCSCALVRSRDRSRETGIRRPPAAPCRRTSPPGAGRSASGAPPRRWCTSTSALYCIEW